MEFYQCDPTRENYWRGIILFGKNVASYKFALAHALYDLRHKQSELLSLEELAQPFSEHFCRHLLTAPKQITSRSSRYIDACNAFNQGEISQDSLINTTVRLGFNNVIDAFHNVNNAEIATRFFVDERKTANSIRLTDDFYHLAETQHFSNLIAETDARWRLVEHAWASGVSRNLLDIAYDAGSSELYRLHQTRRVTITSCRSSLNGYQKGRCFYCYRPIGVNIGDIDLCDVDHFIPWSCRQYIENIDGIWNLVLACQQCNRGQGGKFAHLPSIDLLRRLHKRNEYFITSHLPLRETLIRQTGNTEAARIDFLNTQWNTAHKTGVFHIWQPEACGDPLF